jgi:hypothetical protein
MISFANWMEIAINQEMPELSGSSYQRNVSKIIPQEDSFNIIPMKIGYGTYNIFKKHISPRFSLANRLLDRRGSSVDWVTIKASNEEIANLRELADYIIGTAGDDPRKENEVRTALATIKEIENSMSLTKGE